MHALRRFLLLCLVGSLLFPFRAAFADTPQIKFSHAYMIKASMLTPPSASADWSEVALPHRISASVLNKDLTTYWYRVPFTLKQPPDEVAWLYFPKLRSGGRIFVNGHPASHIPGPDAQHQVRWFQPMLVAVPPLLLRAGVNEISIRIDTRESLTSLDQFYLGPEAPLREMYADTFFWESSTRIIASSLCAVAGMLAIIFWLRRRKEPLYESFGICALMWGARTMILFIPVVSLQWWTLWRALYYFTTGGFIACITLFLLRFSGYPSRLLQWLLNGWWLGGTLLFLVVGADTRVFLDKGWLLAFLPFTLYATFRLCRFAAAQRTVSSITMLITIIVSLGLAIHDFLVQVGWFGLPESYFLHFGIPAFLIAMLWALLDRFIQSTEEAESMSVRLGMLVSARELELETRYARIRQLEREQATIEERQRIMQDMHDGVGSKLISALFLVQRGTADRPEIAGILQESIDEMRLTIDSLSPNEPDLLPALANFRFRMEPRLKRSGLGLVWRNENLPEKLNLGAHDGLHILRILQEAVTNILKHAKAQHVYVTVRQNGNRVEILVEDDGAGLTQEAASLGRGLMNMRTRADKIGADFVMGASPHGGCRLLLSVPLR